MSGLELACVRARRDGRSLEKSCKRREAADSGRPSLYHGRGSSATTNSIHARSCRLRGSWERREDSS
jgi:hypothetical protein